jgi:hypothetical protein
MSYIINCILGRTGATVDTQSYQEGWATWSEAGGPIDAPRHLPRGGHYNSEMPKYEIVILHDTTMRDGYW